MRMLLALYRALLRLYPPAFRARFGAEMEDVFVAALAEARDPLAAAALCVRELRDLPAAALAERAAERRNERRDRMAALPPAHHTSRREMAGVLVLVVVYGILPAAINLLIPYWEPPQSSAWLFAAVLLTPVAILPLVALWRGMPRWSLPLFGFGLALLSAYQVGGAFERTGFGQIRWTDSIYLVQFVFAFTIWIGAPLLGFAFYGVCALLPPLRGFARRVHADWTLLSFTLYGGGLFVLIVTLDDYNYDGPWMIASSLCLAAGAWAYLHAKSKNRKIAALLLGFLGAMAVAAVGKALLYPIQSYGQHFTVRSEVNSTLMHALWFAAGMLAPALLTLLPPPPAAQEADPAPL